MVAADAGLMQIEERCGVEMRVSRCAEDKFDMLASRTTPTLDSSSN
jgi:hypothetical protein